jgi:predicted flap endonuclease-1-like 5' DNA nuclease
MMELFEANRIAVVAVVVVLALLIAWWLATSGRAAARRTEFRDVLSEGAAPAQRNNALIDAPPAAAVTPPPGAGAMVGIGEVVAAAAAEEVAEATQGDDLSRIKGVGPKLRTLLHGLGVTRYEQIAAWTDTDLADLDTKLGAFAGRPARDNWVEQARLLAAADTAGYEAKFGKL